MANIKKSMSDKKAQRYMVIPRNQDTYEEKYAIANGRKVPFETPITLSDKEVKSLEHQKEAFQVDNVLTVYDVMEKYQCDQGAAAKIVAAQAQHKEIGGKTIKWRGKYILQAS